MHPPCTEDMGNANIKCLVYIYNIKYDLFETKKYNVSVLGCDMMDAFVVVLAFVHLTKKWLKFVPKFDKSSRKVLRMTLKIDLEIRKRTQ